MGDATIRWLVCAGLAWMLAAAPVAVSAQGRVEMEIGTMNGFPPLDAQKWSRMLDELKVDRFQIRGGRPGEKPTISTEGDAQRPLYRITAVLTAGGTLVLPPAKQFTLQDRDRLSTWLSELREWGPQGAPAGKPLFGLNSLQYKALKQDLGKKVDFPTQEATHADALAALREKLTHKLDFPAALAKQMQDEDAVGADLRGMAGGTALAYILRPYGFAFQPQRQRSGEIQLVVRPGTEFKEIWPVGWALAGQPADVMPQIMDQLSVEIEPTPIAEILPVLSERLKTPFLLDRNALVKHDVDLEKIKVSYPGKKTWISSVLRSTLHQAGLKFEVRLDDADQPFVWISTLKK